MSAMISIFDLKERACKRPPAVIYDYVRGRAHQQIIPLKNTDDLQARTRDGLAVSPRPTFAHAVDMLTRPHWLSGMLRSRHRTFDNLKGGHECRDVVRKDREPVRSLFRPRHHQVSAQLIGRQAYPQRHHADDARFAIDTLANAIVVSNHGGRRLDSVPSSIDVLPGIASMVCDRIKALFDDGMHSGGGIVRALAPGTHACLTRRAYLNGIATICLLIVACALELLEKEVLDFLALVGLTHVRAVDLCAVTAQPSLRDAAVGLSDRGNPGKLDRL